MYILLFINVIVEFKEQNKNITHKMGNKCTRYVSVRLLSPSHADVEKTNNFCEIFYIIRTGTDDKMCKDGMGGLVISRAACRAISTRSQHFSFMYWLCSKQNCLLCAYEHDFGGNYIITIV
jgi:hypothetical protein